MVTSDGTAEAQHFADTKAMESTTLFSVDSFFSRNSALPYFSIKGHPYQTIPAIASVFTLV